MDKELQKLLENAGLNLTENPVTEYVSAETIKIITKIAGLSRAMDKDDRPGVNNPSKDNLSVYINFILSEVIDGLRVGGYEVNFTERGWED